MRRPSSRRADVSLVEYYYAPRRQLSPTGIVAHAARRSFLVSTARHQPGASIASCRRKRCFARRPAAHTSAKPPAGGRHSARRRQIGDAAQMILHKDRARCAIISALQRRARLLREARAATMQLQVDRRARRRRWPRRRNSHASSSLFFFRR